MLHKVFLQDVAKWVYFDFKSNYTEDVAIKDSTYSKFAEIKNVFDKELDIYVKNDNWNNCKFLTEEYSESYDITGQQKYKLSKLLREILDLNKQNLTV